MIQSSFQNPYEEPSRARVGVGFVNIGEAMRAAGLTTPAPCESRVRVPVEAMTVRQALASREPAAGPLLSEAQGQADLALARACVRRLVTRMAADGRLVSDTSQADAVGAACLALTRWRWTGGDGERLAARVAWRAVVDEISDDCLGDGLPVHTLADDWLWCHRVQGEESREERAARLKLERMARGRRARLLRRLANLPPGRGKRKEAIERVGRAAVFLLQGERLDTAAAMAGFKSSGTGRGAVRPGDRLVQAVKRIGLIDKNRLGDAKRGGFIVIRSTRRR